MKPLTKVIYALIAALFWLTTAQAQVANGYSISLEPLSITGFSGLQSYAKAQYQDKILLIGGRTDGLHRRQPFASFEASDNNTNIIVIAPATQQIWQTSINILPNNLKEQLQSTNMQFIQRGNTLYLMGGYGFSATANDHVTYDKLTAVDIPNLIAAVQTGGAIAPFFRQISNPVVTLTGGQLGRIDSTFYIVGGQKFDGRYNPMGPTHGPGFSQEYSNQIRRFKIQDDGTSLRIYDVSATTDSTNLHRRDYNMLPQIFSGNRHGFTAFSGVFQANIDLPYLNSVDIFPTNHVVNNSFTQYLNHYHSAKLALFDSVNQKMENIFFGGISQYYDSLGVIVQDNNVPFTKSIANVSRNAVGKMTETLIGQMPDYLGAGAEFFFHPQVPVYENEIIKSHQLSGNNILLGYIVGGIRSSAKNVFWTNTGTESDAESRIYKVLLKKTASAIDNTTIPQHSAISQLQIFPNPSDGNFRIRYWLSKPIQYTLNITDETGRLIKTKKINATTVGEQIEDLNFQVAVGVYFITIQTEKEVLTRKIIVD